VTVGHRRRPRGWVDDAGRPVRRCSASLAPQIGRLCRRGDDPRWRGPGNLSVPWRVSGRLAITREGRIANSCPLALSRPALAAVGCAGRPQSVGSAVLRSQKWSRDCWARPVPNGHRWSPPWAAHARKPPARAPAVTGSQAAARVQIPPPPPRHPPPASHPDAGDVSAEHRLAGTPPASVRGSSSGGVVTKARAPGLRGEALAAKAPEDRSGGRVLRCGQRGSRAPQEHARAHQCGGDDQPG